MKIIENIRAWKNRVLPDWLWDLLVGVALTILALIAWALVVWLGVPLDCSLLVLAVPFGFTAWNQLVINRLFEPKDAVLRIVVPVVVYLIILILK